MPNKVMYSAYTAKNRLRGFTGLWMTTQQVGEVLSISPDQVLRYAADGRLRGIHRSNRVMISRGSLERFISCQQQEMDSL